MTDANLADADCVHGRTWWECDECDREKEAYFAEDKSTYADDQGDPW